MGIVTQESYAWYLCININTKTVKARKKATGAGVSNRQGGHSYSDHIAYLYFCCSRWIFSVTYSQLMPLTLEVESKGLLLRFFLESTSGYRV